MELKKGCACGGGPRLLFPCSGAADTGEISDRTARRLAREGFGRMSCLAGVGGRAPFVLDNLKPSAEIWAIDGCPEDCAKRTLELAGLTVAKHLRVTDLGFEKGKSPATDERIAALLGQARAQATC